LVSFECRHDIGEKILIYIDEKEYQTVRDKTISRLKIQLTPGIYNIRIEQYNVLNKPYWLLSLLNPFCFFGYMTFRSRVGILYSYNSTFAQISFKIKVKDEDEHIDLSSNLQLQWLNNDVSDKYYEFSIESNSSIIGEVKTDLPISREFILRWRLLRFIPTITLILADLVIFILLYSRGYTLSIMDYFLYLLVIPAAFTVNAIVVFRAKSVSERIRDSNKKLAEQQRLESMYKYYSNPNKRKYKKGKKRHQGH
jgi:hypothetical protein